VSAVECLFSDLALRYLALIRIEEESPVKEIQRKRRYETSRSWTLK
jgi:hypothetical protein